MKRDMGGAAAILGAFQAAVKAQLAEAAAAGGSTGRARPLHALLCLAENSVAANATRPDDVHTLYSGRTVRILFCEISGGRLARRGGDVEQLSAAARLPATAALSGAFYVPPMVCRLSSPITRANERECA